MTTSTEPQTLEIVERPIGELREHPLNPRKEEESADAITEMRASIAQHGVLQPLLVRADGTVISGHVRLWALQALKQHTVPCIEIDVDDAKALALVIASNEHITPPDPLLEAEAVDELLHPKDTSRPAWTPQQVADALARPLKWVARRAQLRNLSPKIAERYREGKLFRGWPVAWLERIAILSRSAQEHLVASITKEPWRLNRVQDEATLDSWLADELHVLSAAPWDVHDAQLVPQAGPCIAVADHGSSCRKTTISRPGLFDDEIAGDPKTARCCDSGCWAKKLAAHVAAEVAAAEAEHGKVLVVRASSQDMSEATSEAVDALDRNTVAHYNVEKVAAAAKGAVAAVRISGDGKVTRTWVKPFSSGSNSSAGRPAAKAKPDRTEAERLKESKDRVRKQRFAHVVDRVIEILRDEKRAAPPLSVVLGFVAAYEVKAPDEWFHGNVEKVKAIARIAADPEKFSKQLWARVRTAIGVSIHRHSSHEVVGEHQLACWLAEQIGEDVGELWAQAIADVPTPRFWPEGADKDALAVKKPAVPTRPEKREPPAAKASPAKGKAAKGKKARAAAPAEETPGTCSRCGCTEDRACATAAGPCGWENDEQTICSGCVDEMGKPLPRKKAKTKSAAKARKAKG